jgi:hypothetical protein
MRVHGHVRDGGVRDAVAVGRHQPTRGRASDRAGPLPSSSSEVLKTRGSLARGRVGGPRLLSSFSSSCSRRPEASGKREHQASAVVVDRHALDVAKAHRHARFAALQPDDGDLVVAGRDRDRDLIGADPCGGGELVIDHGTPGSARRGSAPKRSTSSRGSGRCTGTHS